MREARPTIYDRMHDRSTLTKASAALALAFLLAPVLAAAHQGGASWEKEMDGYRIDVGYDPNAHVSGASDVFDFALFDAERLAPVPVDELWVRLVRDERTVLATGLRSDPVVQSTLLYAFEKEGEYVLHVSFRRGGATLAEAAFPFTVAPGERSVRGYGLYAAFGAALLLAALGSFYLGKARS
jgi:hypothetical protein